MIGTVEVVALWIANCCLWMVLGYIADQGHHQEKALTCLGIAIGVGMVASGIFLTMIAVFINTLL